MKNLAVGIFHDDELGRKLGKRGTASDVVLYNRKTAGCIYTFMQPVEDKVTVKSQIMSCIDAAIVSFAAMTPAVGETIIMLDSFNISRGIILVPPYTELAKIAAITQRTALEYYVVMEQDSPGIQKTLEEFEITRNTRAPARIVVDHSFPVKGAGEVVLGCVKQGLVRRHDKLLLLPQGTEVVVRSIQEQDKDVTESEAGSRVGLAIKGATAEEMKRGTVICAPGSAKVGTKFTLSFVPNRFYATGLKEGAYHLTIGMQTVPVSVTAVGAGMVTLVTQRPVVYSADDTFLLLDLNAAKVHVVGRGNCQELLG